MDCSAVGWGSSTRWCGWWWIREALEPQRGGTRQDDANRLCWLGLAPVAQLAEQRTFNPWVLGSSPSGGTRFSMHPGTTPCFVIHDRP